MNNTLALLVFFLMSISSYAQEYKDCEDALVLCGASPFIIEVTAGEGMEDTGVAGSCVVQEFASTWIALNVVGAGDLVFELTPTGDETDLDFLVFNLGSDDCESKTIIRCMASGELAGQSASANEPCLGSTGLAYGETDLVEEAGCSAGDNNFLAPIIAEAGDQYLLMINNFSQSEESLQFDLGGTAQLDCIVLVDTDELASAVEDPLFAVSQEGNQIRVETSTLSSQGTLQMYTVNGMVVHEEKVSADEVITINSTMPRGTYILVLRTSDASYSEKIMVMN